MSTCAPEVIVWLVVGVIYVFAVLADPPPTTGQFFIFSVGFVLLTGFIIYSGKGCG